MDKRTALGFLSSLQHSPEGTRFLTAFFGFIYPSPFDFLKDGNNEDARLFVSKLRDWANALEKCIQEGNW